MAADEAVVTPPAGTAARDQRLGGDAAAVELFAHPGHEVVQMELDAGELGLVGTFLFLVRAGYTAPEAEGQIPPRLLGVHGVKDLLLVPDEAVQLVFHAPGGLAPGGSSRGPGSASRYSTPAGSAPVNRPSASRVRLNR